MLLAVFCALFLAVFQYILKSKEKSQLNYWLSFLRFLTLFSIFLLLINPSFQKKTTEISKPNLIVAVDNSKSINYKFQTETVTGLVEKIKKDVTLNNKFKINYFSFGSTLKSLDTLNFKESQTNLAKPINEFSTIYNSGNNPIILITDGNQTIGNAVGFSNNKNPIYPFVVGDTTSINDIFISRLNVNKQTFINNQFPVEIFINYKGKTSVTKTLNIYHNRKRVYTKKINFLKGENVKIESFYLAALEKGTQYYTAKIEELKNERNTINNTKNFSVYIIEEQTNILVLTSILHPDIGMLKKSIESNKQRKVSIKLIDKFKGNLSNYQLVLLYQPNNRFVNVFKIIKKEKLNYFIISGLSTDWSFLNSIQNNFHKKTITDSENYLPKFNENYASFLNTDIGFSSFSPLEDRFGDITFSIPYNTFLYQKIGAIATNSPLLATFKNENQKGAVLFGENSWRWRMNSYSEHKTFELYDGFMSNLIQYLASNVKSRRLNISVDALYYSNETIQISASYLDQNLNFDPRAKLWLTLSNTKNNYLNKIPFALVKNSYAVELSNIPPAEYTYTVSVENQQEKKSGKFKILPFEVEQQFLQSNDEQLKIIASKSKGAIYYTNQEDKLIENLKTNTQFKSIQKQHIKTIPLIDWKWILGIIIILLSVEWFVRKYYGKI